MIRKSKKSNGAQKLSPESARKLYTALVRCRKFEEKIVELYPEKEMKCPTHLSIGQEGVGAGVCAALSDTDRIFSTHRCHSHTIAKGGDFKLMMAELYGKGAGCAKGKGGSMHFVQPEIGVMGASAIVGGTIPLAVGSALAAQMKGEDVVSVAFFGDGAIEQGSFHESANFASLKQLPVILLCENNFIATCTPLSSRQPYDDLYKRADGYNMPGVQVDGTKAQDVFFATKAAAERARKGRGPTMIEARCYRWKEHVGPNTDYHLGHRTQAELEKWMKKCPVKLLEKYLLQNKILPEATLLEISGSIALELDAAVKFAKESPFPAAAEMYSDVY